jgi:hypothetical protein
MIQLNNIGISVDKGVIPRIYKLPFRLSNIGISVDKGTIPPKNYFKSKLSNIGVSLDKANDAEIFYQVN